MAGCGSMARGKSGMCSRHKSEAKAKHRTSDEASEPQVTDEVKQHAVNEAVGKLTGDAAAPETEAEPVSKRARK